MRFVRLIFLWALLIAATTAPPLLNSDQQRIVELDQKVSILESRADSQEKLINMFFGGFAALVAVFGLLPTLSQYLSQRRDRTTQEQFLKGSADTIRLVNDTLGLAKEASERAASSVERRALTELADLDAQSQDIIVRSRQKDDREIVANPTNRTNLEGLAERIAAFDVYTIMLDEKITLTPNCLFIKGMNAHLKQHFDDAIKTWRRCTVSDSADAAIKSLAWYWIGYESNNLGKFEEARDSFDQARKLSDESRALELKRISIESEFFLKATYGRERVIRDIDELVEDVLKRESSYGISQYIDGILQTAGNIYYVYGKEDIRSGQDALGIELIRKAKGFFDGVKGKNKWSKLGSCQCSITLDIDAQVAKRTMSGEIRDAAKNEFVMRIEPRSKTLARLTELTCALAGGAKKAEIDTLYGQVLASLGDVDNRLTLYSLLQRRNVTKDEFRVDLDLAIREKTGT